MPEAKRPGTQSTQSTLSTLSTQSTQSTLTTWGVTAPVVLAPMAGGPSTPQLCAAVSEAGGLPFFAAGYLTAQALDDRLGEIAELGTGTFGVNLFVPGSAPDPADSADTADTADPAYRAYRERIIAEGFADADALPESPVWSDDDYAAKLDIVLASPAQFVSFTFGYPSAEEVDATKAAGKTVVLNATSPRGVDAALDAGADVLVVQGAEAGGHRASVDGADDASMNATIDLVTYATSVTDRSIIAAGGVSGPDDVGALLTAGATAVQVGTLFLLAEEAGTKETHRAAIETLHDRAIVVTRAFTGRPARAVDNDFIRALDAHAPASYPALHYLTSGPRKDADRVGDPERLNLWAGTGFRSAVRAPATGIVRSLVPGENGHAS